MNERIKILYDKSQKVVGHTDGGYTEIKALDAEVFADLIIQMCINICDKHGAYEVIDDIMETFDIRE